MKVFCKKIMWIPTFGPEMEHYAGGGNFGVDLDLFFLTFKLVDIWLNSNTKYDDFISNLISWQQANTLQIEIVRNSSSTKEKLDGTNTTFPVSVMGPVQFEKMPDDQEVYKIKTIKLEQRGTPN